MGVSEVYPTAFPVISLVAGLRGHAPESAPAQTPRVPPRYAVGVPGWRRAVNALAQADERHADMMQVFEHGHKVPEVTSESVQTPAHQHIEASALGILQECVEGGPLVLRTDDAAVYELGAGPATS